MRQMSVQVSQHLGANWGLQLNEYLCTLVKSKTLKWSWMSPVNTKPQNCKTTILWNINMTQYDLHNNHLRNNCYLHLARHQTMGTPKVLSMVILGVGVGTGWLTHCPWGSWWYHRMHTPSQMSLIQKRCWRSITAVQVWVPLSSPHRRVQNDRVLLTVDPGELDNKMWLHDQGHPGLHILQCNRIGYRHWSFSQCSCQLDNFPENILVS